MDQFVGSIRAIFPYIGSGILVSPNEEKLPYCLPSYSIRLRFNMKYGHLLFPVLFFSLLITGAVLIMRTVEEATLNSANPTVYLESGELSVEITAEMVVSTREKAHQAYSRFGNLLVENDALSVEENENLHQILQVAEAHWGEENWAPAFYMFERVLNDLSPLIDQGLGQEQANEMEARYSDLSQSLSGEIILVESTYLQAIETANAGYNELIAKDWIGAIQSFAKALDTLNLVKAQSTEILNAKFKEAYDRFEEGDFEKAAVLFNEVLAAVPYSEDAEAGLQLIEAEKTRLSEEVVDEVALAEEAEPPVPVPEEPELIEMQSEHPAISEADRYYERREFKDSLKLYLEVQAKEPSLPGLQQRIARVRQALRDEELTRLMDKAAILADLQQWDAVVKTYRHILNVDPVHRDARNGWESALVNLVGQKQAEQYRGLLRHHLNAHQFVQAREVYQEARTVLQHREDFNDHFLTLANQLEKQLTPVELVIRSDGQTWVCIPGKFAPEQFTEKKITLFPGKVEVLGWRKGYERTHHTLQFTIENVPEVVSVVCKTRAEKLSYSKKIGGERLAEALKAHDLKGLLEDDEFVNQFLSSPRANVSLGKSSQLKEWDQYLYSNFYTALTKQALQKFELTHLEARGQFIQVPESLSRQETIELGQYLASLD